MVKYNKKAVIYHLTNMSECVIGYIIMFDNENVDEKIQERLKEIKIFAARLHLFYGCKHLKNDCTREINHYSRLYDEAHMLKSGMYTISVIDIKRYHDRKSVIDYDMYNGHQHYRNKRIVNDVVSRAAQLSKRYENCVAHPKSEKEYEEVINNMFEDHECYFGPCKNCQCVGNDTIPKMNERNQINKRVEMGMQTFPRPKVADGRSCYGCRECYDREIERNDSAYFDSFDHVNTLDF
jgi:hypothetical protein